MMTDTQSSSDITELLPCPFCGGEAASVYGRDLLYKVECKECYNARADAFEEAAKAAEKYSVGIAENIRALSVASSYELRVILNAHTKL